MANAKADGASTASEVTPEATPPHDASAQNTGSENATTNLSNNALQPTAELEAQLRRKVDLRLCTIAGILCSLNLLDSGILSSASVTSMPTDLSLTGSRFSVAIFIFTVSSICLQLPATILLRIIGPRVFFSTITTLFGVITLSTAFITTWRQMIALRVLLGIAMSGIYPGLTYLISTWYTRREQQVRYAFLQSGEVTILATGSIVNYAINQNLDHVSGYRGWQYMYIIQGSITIFLGLLTYFWIVDFPEHAHRSFLFLTPEEAGLAVERINADRADAGVLSSDSHGHKPTSQPFTVSAILRPFLDPKLYAFSTLFFLLNLVSTALSVSPGQLAQPYLPYHTQSQPLILGFCVPILLTRAVLPPHYPPVRLWIQLQQIHTPLISSLFLRCPPRLTVLLPRRPPPSARSHYHLQRPLPHHRLLPLRFQHQHLSTLRRNVPRHGSICE